MLASRHRRVQWLAVFARALGPTQFDLPRQRADTNSSGLDDHQASGQFVRVRGNHRPHQVRFRCIRQAIKLKQDDAVNPRALSNDKFAEVAILCDHFSQPRPRGRGQGPYARRPFVILRQMPGPPDCCATQTLR